MGTQLLSQLALAAYCYLKDTATAIVQFTVFYLQCPSLEPNSI